MSPSGFITLRHGTTRQRAEQLLRGPPDPNYIDPGGDWASRAGGFSAVVAGQEDEAIGTPELYARRKAALFPAEGDPVILEIDVPDWVFDPIRSDPFMREIAVGGEVRFEPDYGLKELLQAWPTLPKRIIPL
jgi:hypothetical protein